jgi:hypothetical protein
MYKYVDVSYISISFLSLQKANWQIGRDLPRQIITKQAGSMVEPPKAGDGLYHPFISIYGTEIGIG